MIREDTAKGAAVFFLGNGEAAIAVLEVFKIYTLSLEKRRRLVGSGEWGRRGVSRRR
ncbi:hypothetical protein [Anabaena azotica]|uniref:Uncharacterized protein n=1 Tax=Anabaena azotica FACHB-119 TaxID=947527 RepID=A0ABR8DGA8_9NOST|nr:hypothetical protein [Anabaena azotica]MBD2505445.1 hypothetical protein [Anabaena azotica FACHB-119]